MGLPSRVYGGNIAAHGGDLVADIALSDVGGLDKYDRQAFLELYGMKVDEARRFQGILLFPATCSFFFFFLFSSSLFLL
jgi:hypothetical protein